MGVRGVGFSSWGPGDDKWLNPCGRERERVSSETGAFNLMRAGGWLSKLGSLFGYPKIISAVL